ncbi:hypothetical protein [Leifsonia kafniensis]|uniref:hypothetical protein n=1 Tax=Leifsonia kafniensis TaxID=475957 RepID=UPI0031EED2D9
MKWVAWPFVILLFASVAFVSINVAEQKPISPLDEYVYLDYLSKVPTQGFVRNGEETGDVARHEISCRGVAIYGLYGTGCDTSSTSPDSTFPYEGHTGASIYTPAYFAVTWVLAQPFVWAGMGLLDAGRLVGVVWLSLGTCLTYVLLRRLRAPAPIALGLVLATIATPAIYWATAYISTDAPTLAVSAGLGLVALAVARGRAHWAWFAAASAVAVLFKVQNIAAVGVCALALTVSALVSFWPQRGTPHPVREVTGSLIRSPLVRAGIIAGVAAVGAQIVWLVIRARAALPVADDVQIDSTQLPLSVSALVTESFKFLGAVGGAGIAPGAIGTLVITLLSLLSVGAIVAILFRPRPNQNAETIIAGSTLVVAVLLGPALILGTGLVAGYYVPLTERYGLALLPAFLACIGFLFSGRSRAFGSVVAGLGAALAAWAIISS